MSNQQRVSIVSGAARGIGLALAQALARRGDQLALIDLLFADAEVRAKVAAAVGPRPLPHGSSDASALRRYGQGLRHRTGEVGRSFTCGRDPR